jgi:hypothetical protein
VDATPEVVGRGHNLSSIIFFADFHEKISIITHFPLSKTRSGTPNNHPRMAFPADPLLPRGFHFENFVLILL